jgi:hypothetical protein
MPTSAIRLVHSFPAIETGDHAECRHWGMVNFGYAAGTVVDDDVEMQFEGPVSELTCRSNGLNSFMWRIRPGPKESPESKLDSSTVLNSTGHEDDRNFSIRSINPRFMKSGTANCQKVRNSIAEPQGTQVAMVSGVFDPATPDGYR